MYAQLSPPTQLALIALVAVGFASLFARAFAFFYREKKGVKSIYPSSWSVTQRRTLEQLRLVVGLVVISFWLVLFSIASTVQAKWPHYGVVGLVILLLFVSNAWVLLLLPRNWKTFGALTRSFSAVITFLIFWWITTFTATGWLLAKAAEPPPLHSVFGVYADVMSGIQGRNAPVHLLR